MKLDVFYSILCEQFDITVATQFHGCFVLLSSRSVGLFVFFPCHSQSVSHRLLLPDSMGMQQKLSVEEYSTFQPTKPHYRTKNSDVVACGVLMVM